MAGLADPAGSEGWPDNDFFLVEELVEEETMVCLVAMVILVLLILLA